MWQYVFTYNDDDHHWDYEGPNEVSVIPQPAAVQEKEEKKIIPRLK